MSDNKQPIEDIIIRLDDLQFHHLKAPNHQPLDNVLMRNKKGKPDRYHSNYLRVKPGGIIEFGIRLSDELMADVRAGRKRIIIQMPDGGLPITEGKDAQEFLQSKAGRKVLDKIKKKSVQ